MDTRVAKPGDACAARGLLLALGGTLLLPIVIVAVALSPQNARAWVFELGCVVAASMALWGGVCASRALSLGTDRTVTAIGGSLVGFVVGITTAVVSLWALIGLAL